MLDRLGSHWLHPDRDLHGCKSLSVELLYARDATPGFDWDAVGARIAMCRSKRVPVALRVDWRPRRVLPPMNDEDGVFDYVQAIQQAVADYNPAWIICGNETNLHSETGDEEIQPWWVARVVYGHQQPADRTDNCFQFAKTIDPHVQVLAPAVGPYSPDSAGDATGLRIPDGREMLAPWESYMYDLARGCYDNGWHVPEIGDVKFAMHTYGRTGADGQDNGGAAEPFNDVREGTYGAQFGSRWLQDALWYCRQGLLNSPYGVDYYPGGILISEANTLTDAMPCDSYPTRVICHPAHDHDRLHTDGGVDRQPAGGRPRPGHPRAGGDDAPHAG